MRYNTQLIFGGLLLLIGASIILGILFEINFFAVCFSIGLILFGVWILVRPRLLPEASDFRLLIFGDFRRRGDWQVESEEIWMFIGNIRLDMSEAKIPDGETTYRVIAFINSFNLKIPADVGVRLSSYAFVNDTKIDRDKKDYVFVPFVYKNEAYETAQKKLNIEASSFVGDIDINLIPAPTAETEEPPEL